MMVSVLSPGVLSLHVPWLVLANQTPHPRALQACAEAC